MSQWKKYRKKPVLIEAYQLQSEMKIPTLEGEMTGSAGDYLIRGVAGELYPCKPEIFKKTYTDVALHEPSRIEMLESALDGAIVECKTLLTLFEPHAKNKSALLLHKTLIENFERVLKDK